MWAPVREGDESHWQVGYGNGQVLKVPLQFLHKACLEDMPAEGIRIRSTTLQRVIHMDFPAPWCSHLSLPQEHCKVPYYRAAVMMLLYASFPKDGSGSTSYRHICLAIMQPVQDTAHPLFGCQGDSVARGRQVSAQLDRAGDQAANGLRLSSAVVLRRRGQPKGCVGGKAAVGAVRQERLHLAGRSPDIGQAAVCAPRGICAAETITNKRSFTMCF